jgi:hypothetical protein
MLARLDRAGGITAARWSPEMPRGRIDTDGLLRVSCGPAEEVAATVGLPQIAADFAAMPQSEGAGQGTKSLRSSPLRGGVSREAGTIRDDSGGAQGAPSCACCAARVRAAAPA